MEIRQAHIEQWKKMRNKPLKARMQYFWTYYKWLTIAVLVVLIFTGYYIATVVSAPDETLNGVLLNSANYANNDTLQEQTNRLEASFRDFISKNTDQLKINLDTSRTFSIDASDFTTNYETLQVLMVNIAADNLDFIIGDEALLIDLAYRDMLQNLEDILPAELLHKLSDNLLYIDLAVIRKSEESWGQDADINYPDCTNPDEMEDPVPVLIRINNTSKLTDIYGSQCDSLVFSFTGKEKYNQTLAFLEFILSSD